MGQAEVRSRMDKPLLYQEGGCIRRRHRLHAISHHYHL